MVLFADLDRVDNADDGGVDRAVFHARGHPRRAAAYDEDGFADAGIDGVDGDQIAAFGLPRGSTGRATRACC
jgi:hypothetical protein